MKNISFKNKRKIALDFLNKLNSKVKDFYLDIETLTSLKERRIYKLLKLIYQADGNKVSKEWLKSASTILSSLDTDLSKKKNVNKLFKAITKSNILLLIDKLASEVIKLAIDFANNTFVKSNNIQLIDSHKYLTLGVLRL